MSFHDHHLERWRQRVHILHVACMLPLNPHTTMLHKTVLWKMRAEREFHVGKFITCDIWQMNVVVLELGTINADIFLLGVRIPFKRPNVRPTITLL
jgi:hypothetical protein